MYKVQVTVPAAVTNVGPGLYTLGLALNLQTQIQMLLRPDGDLKVTFAGEGDSVIPADFRNPVLLAANRVFQHFETAPVGLEIHIQNQIPLGVGLGAEVAFTVGGLVAANNLIDADLDRDELVEMAVKMRIPRVLALTAMLGGLNVSIQLDDGTPLYKSLEPPPLRLVVVIPYVPDYPAKTRQAMPRGVPLEAAIHNMGRMVFMMDALVEGNLPLLAHTLQDRIFQKFYTDHIDGFEKALQAAKENGAVAVTLASHGPTLLAFAPYNHNLIAEAMVAEFQKAGIPNCRYWTLGLDAQGVTVSVAS